MPKRCQRVPTIIQKIPLNKRESRKKLETQILFKSLEWRLRSDQHGCGDGKRNFCWRVQQLSLCSCFYEVLRYFVAAVAFGRCCAVDFLLLCCLLMLLRCCSGDVLRVVLLLFWRWSFIALVLIWCCSGADLLLLHYCLACCCMLLPAVVACFHLDGCAFASSSCSCLLLFLLLAGVSCKPLQPKLWQHCNNIGYYNIRQEKTVENNNVWNS